MALKRTKIRHKAIVQECMQLFEEARHKSSEWSDGLKEANFGTLNHASEWSAITGTRPLSYATYTKKTETVPKESREYE